ncbi:MAG: hypothetical protein SynsKO_43760 [Synoicihabitans sp.]
MDPVAEAEREPGREDLMAAAAATAEPAAPPESADSLRPVPAEVEPDALVSLPEGELKSEIEALPARARREALRRIARLEIPAEDFASLRVTGDGKLYYVNDIIPHGHHHGHDHGGVNSLAQRDESQSASITAPTQAAAAVPIATPPVRHSRPGSTNVLYLDFSGHTVTNTSWNSGQGDAETYIGKVYDTDGDPTTFSDDEQADIIAIWERVAEDFSPFDVNVTTEEPAVFTRTTGRGLVTASVDGNGVNMPSHTGGGVAQLDVFGESDYHTRSSPAFVYYDNFSGSRRVANIAEAMSHELGHNMGLTHDGQNGGVEYYGGHGTGNTSWGPIMGTGYGQNVSQWSKGEYFNANNTQDDFALMEAKMGYATDEAGDTTGTAAAASIDGSDISNTGVISSSGDVDLFSFNTATGTVTLNVNTFRMASSTHGGNADLKLELLDSGGAVVATHAPAGDTNATISLGVTAGTYYARISPEGDGTPLNDPPTGYTSYGSAGQYTLTGTIIAAAPSITSTTTASVGVGAEFSYAIVGTNGPSSYAATGLPAGLSVDTNSGVISGRATETGAFSVSLSATNSLGTGNATLTLTVTDAAPVITAQTSGRVLVAPGDNPSFSTTVISANGNPTYGWKRNGQTLAGQTSATLDLTNVTRADHGYYQVMVTNSIGTTTGETIFLMVAPTASQVVVWGDNEYGQTDVPVDLGAVAQLEFGSRHAIALMRDGSLRGWGSDSSGQATVPDGITEAVQVATGSFHGLVLLADGTVQAWGNDFYDQATPPDGLAGVVSIAAGNNSSYAVKSDGTVVAWGRNDNGQSTVPGGLTDVVAIAAGNAHAIAAKADGSVVAWGLNTDGQTSVASGATSTAAVSTGDDFSIAHQSDGSVVMWGENVYGQQTLPDGLTTFAEIIGGAFHTVGLKPDGTVAAWGYNFDGQIEVPAGIGQGFNVTAGFLNSAVVRDAGGDLTPSISTHPVSQSVVEGTDVTLSVVATGGTSILSYQWRKGGVAIDGATASSLSLPNAAGSASGDYDVVVSNQLGSITSNVATLQVAAIPVISAQSAARSLVQPGQTLNLSVTATGTGDLAYQWHRQGKAIDGATSSSYSKSGFGPSDAGVYHVTITDSVGTRRSELMFVLYAPTNSEVIGWGLNDEGQTTIPGGLDDAIAVTSGTTHALALKRDGTVVAWGSNHRGERDVPGDLTNVVQIAAGFRVSYALKSDGTVVEWGSANFTHTGLPDGLSDVIDISYYIFHGIALKADGTVAGWGQNNDGEITIPSNLGQVTQIAAGSSTSYALNDQGELFAWGNGNNGETTVPAASSLWIDVTGGGFHAVGLKSDGTAEGWGFGPYGDPPNGLTGLVAVSAGRQHVLGLSGTGLITAWGANNSGEGDVPSGLDDVFSIAAGYSFSLAIKEIQLPTAPAITTQPESVTVAAGASASFTVAATGFPAPTYQWRKGGVNIDGATSPTFSIGTTAPENAGSYDVVVSNDSGSVNSDTVTLTVQTAPSISAQPQSQTVTVGTQVTLTVTATGDPAPTYQWRKGGVNIDGETSTSLNLGTVALTVAGDYDVVVTNAVSSVTSSPATLTVQEAPAISAQPQPQTVLVGADVTLTVTASGTPAPTYQWRKDGVNIDGATGATLQLIGIATDASGSYDVVVSNEVSSVTSDAALITVQFAPAFSIQPQTQTVNSGANVTLSVAVSGVPAPTLQWRKDGQNISGATAAILDLGAVSPGANGTYDVVATNSVGSTTSAAATLTVLFGPSINTPPTSQTVEVGDAVTFTVSATGDPTPTYQWRKDGVNINGATSASFTIASVALDDAADYDVVVTNSVTSETSAAATLTVNEAPAITTQPESQTVTAGTAVTLTVTATGSPAPTYQWSKDGSPIDGATAASLDLGNIALDDAGNYTVVATNVVDAVTSAIATVAVQVAPEITTQPESQTVQAGTSVAFTVEATGTPSPSFQWRKDGVNIAGETSSSLGLSGVGVADAGSYTVAVFNDVETVVSETATLTVVSITGTHVTNGYRLGDGVTVSNTVTYTGTLTQLIWSVVPPAEIGGQKWSLSASSGTAADVTPNAGTTDLLEWTWNTVPASPFTFAYTLTVPDATAGDHNLAAMLDATSAAGTSQIMATPDPLVLSEAAEFHSADTSGDFRISLSELLRVIEIYNTRLGTTRTGRYKVDETTTDGFAPDPTGGTTQSSFHSADTNRDSQLSLSELLRVIEIYNTREGTTRTGEYHVDDNTVDGFAPGPLQ